MKPVNMLNSKKVVIITLDRQYSLLDRNLFKELSVWKEESQEVLHEDQVKIAWIRVKKRFSKVLQTIIVEETSNEKLIWADNRMLIDKDRLQTQE